MTTNRRRDLCAPVTSLDYHYKAREGRLWLANGCCDMSACTSLFEAIDPEVKVIWTYSNGERDTMYVRIASGEWEARI